MKKIRVLLAEDHTMVREALRALLEMEKDIEIAAEAGDGRKAVSLTLKLRPDIVVLDLAMPLLNGMEATRQILKALPGTKILILSAHSDEAYVERVMALGASGYLLKQSAANTLVKAIHAVLKGGEFFSADVSLRRDRRRNDALRRGETGHDPKPAALTLREAEVLQLVAEGLANKQIADELGISIKTVEKHRQTLMEKLGIHDTAGLTRHALATGVIIAD
jgi:DNA-binding NarL/FixJ family response regulator